MNKEEFTRFLINPGELSNVALNELTDLVKEFPYCQTGRILLTLKLFQEKNVMYDAELKTTAIYVGSRSILKKHIDRLNDDSVRIVLPDEGNSREDEESIQHQKEKTKNKAEDGEKETISHEEEPQFSDKEYRTIDDERSYTVDQLKKIIEKRIREIEAQKKGKSINVTKEKPKSKLEIIEQFIQNQPSISRPSAEFFKAEDVAKESVVDKENIVSETLANIYMDQGLYEKAIRVYEKLILKFPEKSAYFAPLIEKAKKNIKN